VKIGVNQITLNPAAVARVLSMVAFLLVLASSVGQFSKYALGHGSVKGLVQLFNLDAEQNIPTYFQVLLMLFAALILAVIAVLHRMQSIPHASKWAVLSFGFLYMGYDEAFQVHEALGPPLRKLLGSNLGVFYHAWIIPFSALVVLIGLYFTRFLLHLPATVRRRFLIAGTVYLGGAIGMEMIGGRYGELHGQENWIYSMLATIEESLEMAGVITFIWALLRYCADNYKEVQFRIDAQ
jgi:hypothetical protein